MTNRIQTHSLLYFSIKHSASDFVRPVKLHTIPPAARTRLPVGGAQMLLECGREVTDGALRPPIVMTLLAFMLTRA